MQSAPSSPLKWDKNGRTLGTVCHLGLVILNSATAKVLKSKTGILNGSFLHRLPGGQVVTLYLFAQSLSGSCIQLLCGIIVLRESERLGSVHFFWAKFWQIIGKCFWGWCPFCAPKWTCSGIYSPDSLSDFPQQISLCVSFLSLHRECFNSLRPYCHSRRCCGQKTSAVWAFLPCSIHVQPLWSTWMEIRTLDLWSCSLNSWHPSCIYEYFDFDSTNTFSVDGNLYF